MSDGTGAYNRYFCRLNTGKMKIRGVMARKGDTPEYVNKMQQRSSIYWLRQRAWRNCEDSFGWSKIFDYLSWFSCGYGVRWQHPILSGIVMAILFGIHFESYCLIRKTANFFNKRESKNPCKYSFFQNFKKSMSFSVLLLLSLPPEWSHSGRDEFAKFVTRHWFSSILERLIGWGLVLLLIGTLSRLMVRY
jgi:hypothetical protein